MDTSRDLEINSLNAENAAVLIYSTNAYYDVVDDAQCYLENFYSFEDDFWPMLLENADVFHIFDEINTLVVTTFDQKLVAKRYEKKGKVDVFYIASYFPSGQAHLKFIEETNRAPESVETYIRSAGMDFDNFNAVYIFDFDKQTPEINSWIERVTAGLDPRSYRFTFAGAD